ncbi:MAG: phosphohistidine phosphatase SixA [Candidatus Acidiferrum sp.]|jgi:phosphohistidine phosphatase
MELYIVRHGIAIDREDPKSPPDPDRYLTEEGVEKTKQVAKGIAALKIKADLLISSPYVRAMQTAEIFATALDYGKQKIRRCDLLLPGTEPSLFYKELAKEKQSGTIFCFGHAPQLDALIAAGLGSKRQITSLKKAGVAMLELKRLNPPNGQLLWLATPKLLRKSAK